METFKDDVKVYDPVNTKKNVYYSKVMYKDAEISIQLCKNKIYLEKDKLKAKVLVNDNIVEFIKQLSQAVIDITSENSEHFFGKKINTSDCEHIYKEALVGDKLQCFFDEDTYFYESKDCRVNIENLSSELEGIALLKCSAIVYTKTSFFIRWEVSQFKIKKNKSDRHVFVDEYFIKDLKEHEEALDGDPLAKKLGEICLF